MDLERAGNRRWTRRQRLAAIAAERSLRLGGFRRDLRRWLKEVVPPAEYDCYFGEWFGDCRVVPAAHRIVRTGRRVWDTTVEVYEIENSIEIPDWKLSLYGDLADREGPNFELHIIDRHDNEFVVPNDELASFAFARPKEWMRALRKRIRSRAVAQHHAPIIVDHAQADGLKREVARLRRELDEAQRSKAGNRHARWKAAYDALRELGIEV